MTAPTVVIDLLGGDSKTWALVPSAMQAILATTEAQLDARVVTSALSDFAISRPRKGVAAIPITGVITRWPRAGLMAALLGGGTSVENFRFALRVALQDPDVERIVLDVDSPGGETDGLTEIARELYEARSRKPITAFVDTMAGSAAYWIAAQADQIIVTPSGQVGSIGVFALHLDRSRALDAAGVTPTFIQAGRYKTEENPLEPLSDDARSAVQRRVDAFYSMFTKDVARGRGVAVEVVRSSFGEGRMVLAKDAVILGMADEVAKRDAAFADRRRTAAAAVSTSDGVSIAAESAGSAFTYIETRNGGRCEAEAIAAFKSAVLDLGLHGRAPELHFFRAETELDRQLDPWSPRMRRAQAEFGVTFFDGRGHASVWVNAEITSDDFMRRVVRHEVRHNVQPRTLSDEASEVDAEVYAMRSPMTLIDELYGAGLRRAS